MGGGGGISMQFAFLSGKSILHCKKLSQYATKCAPPRGQIDCPHFLCIARISIFGPHTLLAGHLLHTFKLSHTLFGL